MISREQATSIAADNLHRHRQDRVTLSISKVVSLDEITSAIPHPYMAGDERIADCWIIYVNRSDFCGVGASTIMLVSRATGRVAYFGPACDGD